MLRKLAFTALAIAGLGLAIPAASHAQNSCYPARLSARQTGVVMSYYSATVYMAPDKDIFGYLCFMDSKGTFAEGYEISDYAITNNSMTVTGPVKFNKKAAVLTYELIRTSERNWSIAMTIRNTKGAVVFSRSGPVDKGSIICLSP